MKMDKLNKLQDIITDHDETQEILSYKIGVNRNQIRRWIHGESEMGMPRKGMRNVTFDIPILEYDYLKEFSSVLGVSLASLVRSIVQHEISEFLSIQYSLFPPDDEIIKKYL